MAKRIALIHTVKSVLESFEPALRAALPFEIKVHNLLDEFLASDPAETGVFSEVNRLRLAGDLRNAELTGADLVVTTCSTLTPAVAALRPACKVPVIAIDDAMCRRAVRPGGGILVLATARSTLEPTIGKLRAEAAAAGTQVEIAYRVSDEAYAAVKAGDRVRHDRLVTALAETTAFQTGEGGPATPYAAIVLAQASMSHLRDAIQGATGLPTFASLPLCVEEARDMLVRR